jgi:hypothetical protein
MSTGTSADAAVDGGGGGVSVVVEGVKNEGDKTMRMRMTMTMRVTNNLCSKTCMRTKRLDSEVDSGCDNGCCLPIHKAGKLLFEYMEGKGSLTCEV